MSIRAIRLLASVSFSLIVISISSGSIDDSFSRRNNNRRQPRQRRSDDRRVDLIVDLSGDVRFDGGLVHAVLVAPPKHLLLGQIRIRRERSGRRSERRAAVAGAAVLILRAIAPPIGGDDDIGESAFGRFYQQAFDDPRDVHGGMD